MNDIKDLIDKLTEPAFEHVFQRHGDKSRVTTVEVPSLLAQMRDRAAPSGEANGGSSSIKSTRSPADLEAMFEYAKISSQIRDWCRLARFMPTRDPIADLQKWWGRARSLFDEGALDAYGRMLAGWVRRITDHLDGPCRYVPHVVCPVCSGKEWGNAIDGGDLWPIEIRYRMDDDGHRSGDVARCRIPGCGTVWRGIDAIEELASEVDEKRHAEDTYTGVIRSDMIEPLGSSVPTS